MYHLTKEKLNNEVAYVASLSGGKDSLAMIVRLINEGYPLTHILFYDTGMEFRAIYRIVDKVRELAQTRGITFVYLKPETDFLVDMLLRPITKKATGEKQYGYDWCGGRCRWRTACKVSTINKYLDTLVYYVQYIGIAVDEPTRIKDENDKCYPLVDWKMTEKDCLQYCYDNGWSWDEDGVELYDILDRVSCWCCGNKNLKELRNMYHYLPYYWELLKGLQSRIDRPFYTDKTIFDLEERFKQEDAQMTLFDIGLCSGDCKTCKNCF